MNRSAYSGLNAASTRGSCAIPNAPASASAPNHSTITGPNTAPILPAPRDCTKNKPIKMPAVSGTMNRSAAGAATPMPSTAESTEIAGVITPSPNTMPAANSSM